MNEEERTLCSVQSTSWPWHYTFTLTTETLIKDWTRPADTGNGSQRYSLADLSPRIGHQMEFGNGSQPLLRKAGLFLACSTCVFFSQFNNQIPLLAPFLAVAGFWALIAGACRLKQYHWTIIHWSNGDQALFILHSKSNRSQVAAFEKQFTETMADHEQRKGTANNASDATSEAAPGAVPSAHQG